jgi:RND family efflux transporter MFP subunit
LWRWGAALLLALLLGGIAFARFWMAGPPVVAVETATWAPVTRVLAVNGRIAAVNAVDMRPTVTGSLIALPVAEGDLVAAGQILARIDAAAQNAMVRQAMAGLDSALVAQKQARETYERAAALGPNVASTVLESNAYAVQTAAQEVARQTAALDQAQIALENHTLRAPIAGSVLALDAELGQIVGPSIPLLTLADLGNLMVEADVDESYAMQIAVDQPAALQLAGETSVRDGRVSFVSTRVDAATGGLGVRVVFDDPVTAPIGLTVALNIIVDRRDAALTVPRTALLTDAEGTGVFVVREGVAQRHPLSVLDWPAARLIVTGGLEEGDLVITDTTGIADGQTVAVDRP